MSNYEDVLEQTAILDSAISSAIDSKLVDLHTMLPATVTKVDLVNQLLEIELGVKRVYKNGQEIVVPPIAQVPLAVLRGGGWVITLPVAVGDQGAAFFSEREMTQWMLAGDQGAVTPRLYHKHDYTDAYFLPALASSAKKVLNYDTTNLEIRSLDNMTKQTFNSMYIKLQVGGVTMTLDSSGLHVTNGTITSNVDVIAGVDNISLSTHIHTSAAAGSPTSPPLPG